MKRAPPLVGTRPSRWQGDGEAELEDPEEAAMRDETIKLLALTTVDVLLDESGQLQSTTQLTGPAPRRAKK
jgi:hypothetical protein